MIRKKAILYIESIHCHKHKEANGDDIYFNVYGDGVKLDQQGCWNMKKGETDRVDLEIECTYYDEIVIDIWEADKHDEHIGKAYIQRTDTLDENNCGSRKVHESGGKREYEISFRVISDPIPTVRVLGIRCEQDSAGMDGGVVNAIADVAIACTEAAGKVLGKSPRPSRKLMGDAMLAASKVMKGTQKIVGWIREAIEGPDDVYIRHIANTGTRGYDGAFFPPEGEGEVYGMVSGDEVHFEDKYGYYFRFPLDEGKVTIEFRDKDLWLAKDIIIGSIIIDPEEIKENTANGIEGGTIENNGKEETDPIEGGLAVYDGPAVVEVANCYYDNADGAGAIYYICYSVGTENWLLPPTTAGQGDINDGVLPESVSGYFKSPLGPSDYPTALAHCEGESGELPTVEDMDLLITNGWIPDSWPKGNYWLADNFYINIETRAFDSTVDHPNPPECFFSCKMPDQKSGIEGWNGTYGVALSSPDGMVDFATADARATAQGDELPTAEMLNDMVENGMIPDNWPDGPYWVQGEQWINLPGGGATSADPLPAYFTVRTEHFEEDIVHPWEGIGGYYAFPQGTVNYNDAMSGSQFLGGELPSLEHFQLLIDQNMIPASWPAGNYWTADKQWVDISNHRSFGTSADGKEQYHYAAFIAGLPNEVETIPPFETEERLFASPMGPVSLHEAREICQQRGGELPTLETLRLMVEQNQVPAEWPKDKYYYTDNGYMVNLSAPGESGAVKSEDEPIIWSEDGDHPCYFSCEFKKIAYDPKAHGAFGPPQYLTDYAYAQADCTAKGGALPTLEDMLYLIKNDRIPNWLPGYYWAVASPNTLIYVHSVTGDYWYSETGSELCFYSCHKAGEKDGVEDWQPGDGLYLHPEAATATFADAQAACQAQGGDLPSIQEMELIIQQFQEGTIPNTWPRDSGVYYWTKEGKAVDRNNYEHVITPDGSAKYHFTCKKNDAFNGIMTGYEIRDGHYLYTLPLKKQTYNDAIDNCLWYGGEMATMEDMAYLIDNNKIPSAWPGGTNVWYMTRDGYHITPRSDLWNVEWGYDPNPPNSDHKYYFTCKIREEGYEEEITGHFASPLELRADDAWEDCASKGGAMPSLSEMLFLIENGLIPDNWPSDYLYHAGPTGGAFTVSIETGEYHFVGNPEWNDANLYYSCKTPSEELRVERFAGADAFYAFPAAEPASYAQAYNACKMDGGQLPTVTSLRNLIKHGNIPDTWPAGSYWLNGGYIMDIASGSFRHSPDGSELCRYSCRIINWAQTVAKGDEVAYGGNVFLSPQGPNAWEPAEAYARVDNGKLPSEAELKGVIDAKVVPESWPSGNYYYNSNEHCLDISNSANSDWSETAYHTTRAANPNGYRLSTGGEGFIPGMWYYLKAKHSSRPIAVEGGVNSVDTDGKPLVQWEGSGDNFLFRFEKDQDGYYRIFVKHSGKLLYVDGVSTENGARIKQWEKQDNQGDHVLFRVEIAGEYCRLIAKHSGKCISVADASLADGAAVVQYEHADRDDQLFSIEPL